MNKSSYCPKSYRDNFVVQSLQDDILIYNTETNKAHCLNRGSAAVWNACNGIATIEEIAEAVSRQMDSPVSGQFVWLALEQLEKEGLVVKDENFKVDFDGLSRREVIRKIGLTTMVALPVVSSLVAPSAAMAASTCVPDGQTCATTSECCPGLICEGTCVPQGGIPG